ncbi:hypothetical protein EON63_14450 [archaeon]|nr:MAG: hypothetical protein EON63_14450 [archaeon]
MAKVRAIIRFIMVILGLYEFYIAYEYIMTKEQDYPALRLNHYIFPKTFIYEFYPRMACVMFAVFLGFNRLSWATGNGGLGPWLCLVGTHIAEMIYLWGIAFTSTHFNTRSIPFEEFVQKVVKFEVGNKESTLVLCVVPVLVFLSIIHGPYKFGSIFGEKKSKTN